jgi:hypothetical protein
MKLTDLPELKDLNHILATDNWYTSLEVAAFLIAFMIHLVGTIKSNRKGIPKEAIIPKIGVGKKDRGFMQTLKAKFKGNELYLNTWMDSKPVLVLSTWQPEKDFVSRASKDANGKYVSAMVARHSTTGVYNNIMGGTDSNDQRSQYISTMLRSVKWTLRPITHFASVAGINALVIHTMICQKRDPYHKPETTIDFIENLCRELLEAFPRDLPVVEEVDVEEQAPNLIQAAPKRPKIAWEELWHDRIEGPMHTVEITERVPGGADQRGRCKACKSDSKISSRCVECGVYLHCRGTKEDSCWWRFHHLKTGFCK